jgi:hypothetical protein
VTIGFCPVTGHVAHGRVERLGVRERFAQADVETIFRRRGTCIGLA